MFFCGLNKSTLLDYPGIVAATVFLGGCNFRCPYCHNMELVTDPAGNVSTSREEILTHLKKRSGIIKGVCITGGEPTLNPELPGFIRQCRDLGLKVKLDTNGTDPDMLKELYNERLINYAAMDIKTCLSDYEKVAGLTQMAKKADKAAVTDTEKTDPDSGSKHGDGMIRPGKTDRYQGSGRIEKILENVKESVRFLINETHRDDFDYEFRTTVVKELMDEESFNEIADWIKGARHYYLQSYKTPEGIKDPGFTAYDEKELQGFLNLISDRVPSAALRGI